MHSDEQSPLSVAMTAVFTAILLLASVSVVWGAWSVLEGQTRNGLVGFVLGGLVAHGAHRRWQARKEPGH